MDVTLIVAAIVLLVFGGILLILSRLRNPSIQDAVTEDVVTKALTGPVPVPGARARLDAPNRQTPEDPEVEVKDEAA